MDEELQALEENDVWNVVRLAKDAHSLHSKWVYKTNKDASGDLERYKARLVTCENEEVFGRDYNITIAAVMEMSSVKVILALARKWRAPAKHGDTSNAYVKAKKEPDLNFFLRIPQVMKIKRELVESLRAARANDLALELHKALYGLKQAGRLRSELLHKKLENLNFTQCLTDTCVYWKRTNEIVVVVGVYVDDLLVTATKLHLVCIFLGLQELAIKDLGIVHKFLGMRISYDGDDGYNIDQEVSTRNATG